MSTTNATQAPENRRPHRPRDVHSVADRVVEAIEAQIADEGLRAGYRVGTKQELCEFHGVAPATLGEALRVLRARSAIEVRPGPGGGIFVAEQSPLIKLAHNVTQLRKNGATVNDVIGVLDALDESVMRDAAAFRTDADLVELDALIAELADSWKDPVIGVHVNWRLHRRIANITPNVVLRTFYQNLVDYIEGEGESDVSLQAAGFTPDSDERLAIHYSLVEAIRSGDKTRASEALRQHRTR